MHLFLCFFKRTLQLYLYNNFFNTFLYFEKIYDPESYSKFEAYHFIDDQLSGEQLTTYTRIFQILNKLSPVKINNLDKNLTYFELVNEFESSFEILNYEIIKYLKP